MDNAGHHGLDRRDLFAILAVVALCLVLRVPALDRIALNPDESQYEATAAYLLATGSSAFELPHTTAGTYVVYTILARWFGPFTMLPVRLLVLGISLALGLIVYLASRRVTATWAALFAGLVAVHYAIPFEGYTANREWFCLLPLMASALLVQSSSSASPRRGMTSMVVAGVLAGGALWFKAQALPIVMAVPLFVILRAVIDRRLMPAVRELIAYGIGASISVVAYLLGFFMAGSLDSFFSTTIEGWVSVQENELASSAGIPDTLRLWRDRLFLQVKFRPLLLVAYFFSILSLVAAAGARRFGRSRFVSDSHARAGLLYGSFLITSLVAVKMGGLFWGHYYLFLVPPVAILVALALDSLVGDSTERRWPVGAALVGLLVTDRILFVVAGYSASILTTLSRHLPIVIYSCLLAAVALAWVWRPSRRSGLALLAFCAVEVAALVVQTQFAPRPPSLQYHRDHFDELARQVSSRQSEGDRIFVWGWLPEIYSRLRLEPASLLILGQYVVTDYEKSSTGSKIDTKMAARLMQDLEQRRPRFIVDAWRRSWTIDELNDPRVYDLRRYPQFGLNALLRDRYRRVGRFSGCELYELAPPVDAGDSVSP